MLIAQDLACLRGDRLLFKEIGFTLNASGLMYVLGENGSGKSSLLRIVCGLLSPELGVITWQGQCIKQSSEEYLCNLTYIGHLNGLKDDLTAMENLQISARLAGGYVDDQAALEALTAIGIARCAKLPVGVLSQGQKRRVALARLWLSHAPLWVLDEPFAALDTASVLILAARISLHIARGGMTIITTHQDVVINAQTTQTLRLCA